MPRVNIDLIYMPSVRAPFTQVCPSQTLTLHPFPPPSSSPRSEDDLTFKLADIIRANNQLKKQVRQPGSLNPKPDNPHPPPCTRCL